MKEEKGTVRELNRIDEKSAHEINGWLMVGFLLIFLIGAIVCFAIGVSASNGFYAEELTALIFVGVALLIVSFIVLGGFRLLRPNEAYVLTLFGKYYGTIKRDGFFWVNPFCSAVNPARVVGVSKKLSLKAMTLNNEKQKVNDEEGNPIEISVVVIWRIVNTSRAVFNVDNYMAYISTQCDAAIRQVARQ